MDKIAGYRCLAEQALTDLIVLCRLKLFKNKPKLIPMRQSLAWRKGRLHLEQYGLQHILKLLIHGKLIHCLAISV